jgi:hypothetical protein
MLSLTQMIAEELAVPALPQVHAFAAHIAAQYPGAARAVLFYGSCLRSEQLEGQMLDFYLIVSDYEAAYGKGWLAKWNRRLPPNVFPFQYEGLMAKVAVLSEADFRDLNRPEASAVSVWARFAQPSRLVWAADGVAQNNVASSICEAPITLFQLTLPMVSGETDHDIKALWQTGFELTYGAELRAERTDRSASVIDFDPDRYQAFGLATLSEIAGRMGVGPNGEVPNYLSPEAASKRWKALRRNGKLLTAARLGKAAFTYSGGIDYLAWKINRHAGTQIEIKPWQRKWPLVAAVFLVPKLLAKGAVR